MEVGQKNLTGDREFSRHETCGRGKERGKTAGGEKTESVPSQHRGGRQKTKEKKRRHC